VTAKPIPSPCRQICRAGRDGVCDGCGRTLQEIAAWLMMTDRERQLVIERVKQWAIREPG
jgi:predicted Fe-S protein YdhL (DUF1289 family)